MSWWKRTKQIVNDGFFNFNKPLSWENAANVAMLGGAIVAAPFTGSGSLWAFGGKVAAQASAKAAVRNGVKGTLQAVGNGIKGTLGLAKKAVTRPVKAKAQVPLPGGGTVEKVVKTGNREFSLKRAATLAIGDQVITGGAVRNTAINAATGVAGAFSDNDDNGASDNSTRSPLRYTFDLVRDPVGTIGGTLKDTFNMAKEYDPSGGYLAATAAVFAVDKLLGTIGLGIPFSGLIMTGMVLYGAYKAYEAANCLEQSQKGSKQPLPDSATEAFRPNEKSSAVSSVTASPVGPY